MKNKLLVILGPTATGKTDVALALAKKFNGELVACDSRQIYKSLDIGTGKEPGKSSQFPVDSFQKGEGWWEVDGVKIWMYDVVDPNTQYSVYDYIQDAVKVINDVSTREKLPILVGGTGLYLRRLFDGFDQFATPIDPELRERMQDLSINQLQAKLQELSPTNWNKLNQSDQSNPRRLIRKIEQVSMYPYINTSNTPSALGKSLDILKIGLTAPRSLLYSRIDDRLDSRLDLGLIAEGQKLLESGVTTGRMRQLGLEYASLADLLEGKITAEELTSKLKIKIHQYAKRQLTWFKKEKDVVWFDVSEDISHRVEKTVESWYNSPNGSSKKS